MKLQSYVIIKLAYIMIAGLGINVHPENTAYPLILQRESVSRR